VCLGSRPVTAALADFVDVPEPAERTVVWDLKLVVVPYWNCAVVALPSGLTVPLSVAV
jgi:hypothetical protein